MQEQTPKRGRGRPRKHPAPQTAPIKRGRGRPRKHGAVDASKNANNPVAPVFGAEAIPDLSDPLNTAVAAKVLDLAYDVFLSPQGRKRLSTVETLQPIFGKPFFRFWRSFFNQLETHGPGRSALYTVQPSKLKALAAAAGTSVHLLQAAQQRGFDFTVPADARSALPRTGHRVYPWWALMKREVRHELFLLSHGQGWDYDLRAAKQALLLQWLQRERRVSLPVWQAYAENPDPLRAELMAALDIDRDTAKFVVQAVLNGGQCGNGKSAIGRRLGAERAVVCRELKVYRDLVSEFKRWHKAARDLNAELNLFVPEPDQTPGQFAEAVYERLEDTVMTVVERELSSLTIPHWFVHDGFLSNCELDAHALTEISRAIHFETGFDVSFKRTPLTNWFEQSVEFETSDT